MDESDDDFGYDFSPDEEQLLLQLASASPTIASAIPARQHQATANIDSLPGKATDINSQASKLKNEAVSDDGIVLAEAATAQDWSVDDALPVQVEDSVAYPNLSRALEQLDSKVGEEKPAEELLSEDEFDDGRSPLQKFRSFPRRPLTVTDLTAGAWCELQYWYTLTKLPGGRRTRTAAMRQGSKVHQKLEDEVHTTVRVEVTSREDAFGLRLWNFIQGLRTLRDTGLTRELEVWGMLNGNLVNGVIDVLSYKNPNPEFEEELDSETSTTQPKLTHFFAINKPKKQPNSAKKIYLTDVKTRGSSAPVSKALLRPAKIQLLLYHRFLSEMAGDNIDLFRVMRRYGLDADEPFSDAFLAQIGSLHDEIFDFTSPQSSVQESGASITDSMPQSGTDSSSTASQLLSTPDLVKYMSLRELVALVKEEIRIAFPDGSNSMGNMLQVQYVHREDGRILDLHDFPVSPMALEEYLGSYMKWWQGERKATGVEIEEAFKCRTCEFAESCSWRREMDNERVRKARAKSRGVIA